MDIDILEHLPREANIERVAAGGAEFCITSVKHYLSARARFGALPARFVGVIGQRHTIGGLVPADAAARHPGDLAGLRLGGDPDSPLVQSFQAGLRHLGHAPAKLVATNEPAPALGRAEADVIAATVDTVRRNERQSGLLLRAIPLDTDVYMSGIVAGDHVAAETVEAMLTALRGSLEHQRREPDAGLSTLVATHPDVDPEDTRQGWRAVERFIFTQAPLLSMTADGWQRALDATCAAHRLPQLEPESVYRPELCLQ